MKKNKRRGYSVALFFSYDPYDLYALCGKKEGDNNESKSRKC
jgi:hypothetical protein